MGMDPICRITYFLFFIIFWNFIKQTINANRQWLFIALGSPSHTHTYVPLTLYNEMGFHPSELITQKNSKWMKSLSFNDRTVCILYTYDVYVGWSIRMERPGHPSKLSFTTNISIWIILWEQLRCSITKTTNNRPMGRILSSTSKWLVRADGACVYDLSVSFHSAAWFLAPDDAQLYKI